ncbi:MAG: hypothetical protein J7M05_10140, partial [Anaerolineae bacterium]|nr:hypothetical protein [Anaerolineae bacterium]
PAGSLFSLSLVALVDELFPSFEGGTILFGGMGVTFLILALFPRGGKRQLWAIFPAIGCFLVALLAFPPFPQILRYAGPAGLIAAGLYLLLRALGHRSAE